MQGSCIHLQLSWHQKPKLQEKVVHWLQMMTKLARRIKILREKERINIHSLPITYKGYYEYVDIGNSYVQSNILGALGVTQLKKLDKMNLRRKEIADYYLSELSGIQGLDFLRITEGSQP